MTYWEEFDPAYPCLCQLYLYANKGDDNGDDVYLASSEEFKYVVETNEAKQNIVTALTAFLALSLV